MIRKLALLGLFVVMMLSAPDLARSEFIDAKQEDISINYLIFQSIKTASDDQAEWYNSVLISSLLSFALGAILTYLGNYIYSNLQERKELDRYEYYILSVTLNLITRMSEEGSESNRRDLKDLLNKVHSELRFFKLSTYQLVIAGLSKAYSGSDASDEVRRIRDRLENLKNGTPRQSETSNLV